MSENKDQTDSVGFEASEETDAKKVEISEENDAKSWTSQLKDALKKPKESLATMPVERDAAEYNMNHPERGRAIIFNNRTFKTGGLSPRNGSDVDRDKLKTCLEGLGFQLSVYNDPTHADIQNVIHETAKEDHTNRDCLLIAVFSHGVPNLIYSSDSQYKPDSLWDPFTADRCPSLAGKPKIFIIQACQGDQLDGGTTLQKKRTQTDSLPSGSNDNYRVPNRADFLMAFSTVPGYYSWRNTSQGSWFIQSVTKIFNTYQHRVDLLQMMTHIARNVALNFESFVPTSDTMDRQKQVPFITSTLIREVYFKPKPKVQ